MGSALNSASGCEQIQATKSISVHFELKKQKSEIEKKTKKVKNR